MDKNENWYIKSMDFKGDINHSQLSITLELEWNENTFEIYKKYLRIFKENIKNMKNSIATIDINYNEGTRKIQIRDNNEI